MKPLTACVLLLNAHLALADHPLSDPKVFVSREGVRAVIASVKAASPDRCVLLVAGIKGELDGLVLDCRAERRESQVTYFVVRRGREERAMRTDGTGTAGLAGSPIMLDYSDAESKKENLEALWAKHQAQLSQLAALTKFDRAGEAAAAAEELNKAVEPLNQACGTKLVFALDWSGASDEIFKSTRSQRSCLELVATMQDMCSRYKVVRSTFAQKLSQVRCSFGDREPAFAVEGTTLSVSSSHETTSMPGAFERYIREAL